MRLEKNKSGEGKEIKEESKKKVQQTTAEVRDRRQKTFGFLSRLCLLRVGGGQGKSAKNCQFPDESLLF